MMDELKKYKWVITTAITVLLFGWWIMGIADDAEQAKREVQQIQKTYKSIEAIALQVQANQEALASRKRILGDYLINNGENPRIVKYWMSMPIGLAELKLGEDSGKVQYLLDIPFIMDDFLPEKGVRAVIKKPPDSAAAVRVFDTLWDHTKE